MFAGRNPSSESLRRAVCLSMTRMTIFSPWTVGKVATRRSTGRPWMTMLMRPSWGMRRSAILMSAMTFSRLIMPFWILRGLRIISCSTPSIR